EALGQGAAAALPIYALFMKKVYADKTLGIDETAKFTEPDGFKDCAFYDPGSEERAGTTPHGQSSTGNEEDTENEDFEQVPNISDEEWNR
nr:hypothetical protein [Flavipsychrobacter sp.]